MKNIIITGCLGQDGRIMTEMLINKKFNVYGISKNHLYLNSKKIGLINIYSKDKIYKLIKKIKPLYLFYFAGFKHSSEQINLINKDIFDESLKVHVTGYKNFLEGIIKYNSDTKVFYASSSHIYGPQKSNNKINNRSSINPISPYAITKAFGTHISAYYRKEYNLNIYVGIFCNHESELSSEKYILSKIINGAINIKLNKKPTITIGSLNDYIDVGYSRDYMKIIYEIVRDFKPDNYIISLGNKFLIKAIIRKVFKILNIDYKNKLIINNNLLSKKNKLNLFGTNKSIKKTKAFKKTLSLDEFLKKIIKYKLENI